jgi:hypothetical protein
METRRVEDLYRFIDALIELLDLVNGARDVLFRRPFRDNLMEPLAMSIENLRELATELERNRGTESLMQAGLDEGNPHLVLKLESFSDSLEALDDHGGEDNLQQALEKGNVILGSLLEALPVVGSAARELIDFIVQELKKRRYRWIFR